MGSTEGTPEECRAVRDTDYLRGGVWRGGTGANTNTARALKGIREVQIDPVLARRAGALLAAVGHDDPVDALVVACAEKHNARVITGDPMCKRSLNTAVSHAGRCPER